MRIKLYTHEVIVHTQISAIEKALKRNIDFAISLNKRLSRSSIEFDIEENELSTIKNDLGYNVMVFDGIRWMPHL